MEITSGRNKSRSGAAEQPVEVGQILRRIREGAIAHRDQQVPEAPLHVEGNRPLATKARARPGKTKLIPQEVVPEYDGPPITGNQELR
eukprot:16259715-Heterocapsa_arctica.AAC.1